MLNVSQNNKQVENDQLSVYITINKYNNEGATVLSPHKPKHQATKQANYPTR